MKLVALALASLAAALAGCQDTCASPDDCLGGDVCAIDGTCTAPSDLVIAQVAWTIAGQPATAATCAGASVRVGFVLGFGEQVREYAFAPVPCAPGAYTAADVPTFDEVELGYDTGDGFDHGMLATPDGSGVAMFDLPAPPSE